MSGKALIAIAYCGSLLCALPVAAADIAVLVDVSGTMGHYGLWQPEAATLIHSILDGEFRHAAWDREGKATEPLDFKLSPGAKIHLVRFGSIHSESSPYFRSPLTLTSPEELHKVFPQNPIEYSEAKTNKSLAQAVGGALAEDGEGAIRLIVVSDFLVDAELNSEQRQFVNSFESRVQTDPPVIYSWRTNPRVQVRLMSFKSMRRGPVAPSDVSPSASVRLSSARLYESPKRVSFTWSIVPDTPEVLYDIAVQNKRSGVVSFSRSGVLALSAIWPNPDSGDYVWKVTARLSDGTRLSSTAAPLSIPGASVGPVLLWGGLLAAFTIVVWHLSKRRSARKLLESSPERKKP